MLWETKGHPMKIIKVLKQAQAWEFVSKYDDTLDHIVEQEETSPVVKTAAYNCQSTDERP